MQFHFEVEVNHENYSARQATLEARRSRLSAAKQDLLQKRLRCEIAAPLKPTSPLPSCLVEIQRTGTRSPFFCVHPLGGDVLCFFPLARFMGPDHPFFGFQSQGLQDDLEPLTCIEDMASLYAREIRRIQPDGPIDIGGWSFGGLVAFEMAQQLQQLGSQIGLLVILDTTPGMAPEQLHETRSVGFYEDNRKWLLAIAHYVEGLWGRKLSISESELQRRTQEEQLEYFVERLKSINLMSSNVTLHQLRRLLNVFKSNSRAWCSYVPKPYAGPITLIRSKEDFGEAVSMVEQAQTSRDMGSFQNDTALGWGAFSMEPVEIVTVPGTHLTMLAEPNVQVLANRLTTCLDKIVAVAK